MKAFAALYSDLDAATARSARPAALQACLRAARPEDSVWAGYCLAGGKPRQLVPSQLLRELAREAAGLPEWLIAESHAAVGEQAETISLLLPLHGLPPDELSLRLRRQSNALPVADRVVHLKLITGAFRVGVCKLTQALAAVSGVDAKQVAQRLMGCTPTGAKPSAEDCSALVVPGRATAPSGRRFPIFLAHPFIQPLAALDELLGAPTYAQRGHGRRASLYSDSTFAVWNGAPDDLARQPVPFAKACSGLADAEMRQVDAIIRKTTVQSLVPLRSVTPTRVFELGFDGIARSPRHRSGVALRLPRRLRWRQDKPVAEADALSSLLAWLS